MRAFRIITPAAAAALASGVLAFASAAMADPPAAPPPPSADAMAPAPAPAPIGDASAPVGSPDNPIKQSSPTAPDDAYHLKAGDPTVISNPPIPDTPDNRARYGKPMSNGGAHTAPAGN